MSAQALKKTARPIPTPTRRRTRPRLTPEEYLAMEREAAYKSEYWDGKMLAMAGASRSHNQIVSNLVVELGIQLRTRSCSVYANDMRVRAPETITYTYPDVVVTCGEESFADESFDVLLNPIVIIEVLSKSTEAYDRGQKFQNYQQIPSLAAYLLVSQERYHVEMYVKQTDKLWLYSSASDPEEVITLAPINCKLSLKEIYAKVKIVPKQDDAD
ncbi:MAG: Uma2 family endonuclease [Ardenticatenaceae bacterium]